MMRSLAAGVPGFMPGARSGNVIGGRGSVAIDWFYASAPPSPHRSVWDDIWRQPGLQTKDERVLDRERRGPRWALINAAVETEFGKISGLRTIELGSGRGDLSTLLAGKGADVTLVDVSAPALQHAESRFQRHRLSARFVQADIRCDLVDLHGRFDVATSLGVIEHFRGSMRDRVIRAHYNLLRPGGVCIIGVPNAACPPYRLWKLYLETVRWWPYGMEIPYTRRELGSRARRSGFERIDVQCTGFWQSVGDFWCGGLAHRHMDWANVRSRCDRWWGANLLLIARRPGEGNRQNSCTSSF
ncbi:MAG: class I SAM-dependent methyltransferase [Phycisphaerales bacterium]|nr:class I SAM-dependent methyltransferase [Phycisphaerales bacterium]